MPLPFETDGGNGSLARIGLIVLQTDETMENELRRAFSDTGIACYHTRLPSQPVVTNETLAQMARDLPQTAALLPRDFDFTAIGYGCTSGATVIGQDAVASMIQKHHPKVPVSDPITAVMAGLRAFGAKQIGLLTPYVQQVSTAMRELLEHNGFKISNFGSFQQESEKVVAHISEDSTLQAIIDVGSSETCDAVFVSCTNLRSFGILAQAEAAIGKPVVSSNQALAWHLLRLSGVNKQLAGLGRLLEI